MNPEIYYADILMLDFVPTQHSCIESYMNLRKKDTINRSLCHPVQDKHNMQKWHLVIPHAHSGITIPAGH